MGERTAQLAACAVLMIFSLPVPLLQAQQAEATLSGKVTDSSGSALPNAKVSVRNVETSQAAEVRTDGTGTYNLPKLAPGDYELTVSVKGFTVNTGKVTLTAGAKLTYNATLTALPPEPQPQSPASAGAGAPASNNAPSLQDLGFSPAEIKGNPKEQALLEKRTHMLKIHQRLGLITTLPMIASVATSINAGGRNTSNTDRTVHMILGSATAGLYSTTAYFAIRADARVGDKIPRADSLS